MIDALGAGLGSSRGAQFELQNNDVSMVTCDMYLGELFLVLNVYHALYLPVNLVYSLFRRKYIGGIAVSSAVLYDHLTGGAADMLRCHTREYTFHSRFSKDLQIFSIPTLFFVSESLLTNQRTFPYDLSH